MSYRGYHFFIGDVELPYAPSELTISIGSNNQTVQLISGQEVNLLSAPKLTEITFKADLPRGREYPFARNTKLTAPEIFTDYFEDIKVNKKPIWLIITRPNPNATPKAIRDILKKGTTSIRLTPTVSIPVVNDFNSTKLKVTLESYDMKESADNAFDVTVSFTFKRYVEYGTVERIVVKPKKTSGNPSSKNKPVKKTPKKVTKNKTYTVKSGDCLWKIAKKFYGDGTKWKKIYNANKKLIEKTAKKYGKKSSSNGHWIYPGTKLTIPMS